MTLDGRVTGLPEPDADAEDESAARSSSRSLIRASARMARVANAESASWF
jgi:hypothetical protein